MEEVQRWLNPPQNFKKSLFTVLPLMIAQMFMRLFLIVDNRYIAKLGHHALYIQSIQINFFTLGQFIGTAAATAALVLWKREEHSQEQGNIFIKIISLNVIISLLFALVFWLLAANWAHWFNVNESYTSVASMYFKIASINILFISLYIVLDGLLIASNLQKISMIITIAIVITKLIIDYLIIHFFSTAVSASAIYKPLMYFGLATTVIFTIAILISIKLIYNRIKSWQKTSLSNISKLWLSELGICLLRAASPFIFTFLLAKILNYPGFLITYQLTLNVAFLFCLPILGGMQIAVREASAEVSRQYQVDPNFNWRSVLLYTGLAPAIILLLLLSLFPTGMIHLFYHYSEIPSNQLIFIPLFGFACILGQITNTLGVNIRAHKKNHLMTRNFFLAEAVFLLGGTALLVYFKLATPLSIGIITVLYAGCFLLLNLLTNIAIKQQMVKC